jgi:hypothetical protein
MGQVEADIWDAQKQRLAALFARVGHIPALGDCRGVRISGPIHVSGHARLFLCALPHRAETFLAKCFYLSGTERADIEDARHQYEALVHLNETRGATSGFNLVQPFHLFADEGIIAQSWIEGKSLDRAFGDATFSIGRLMEHVAAAGTWLGHFHRFGRDGRTATVSGTLMDEIADQAKPLGPRGRVLNEAVQTLRNSPLADGRTLQPVTTLHCDFKPANVIVAKDGVCAIDFQLSTRASIYFDLAHFLNSLAIDTMKARRASLLLRARQMQRAFIAGYERVAGPIDPLILAYYLTYDLSRYMVQHGDAQTTGLAGRGKWWAMGRLLALRLARFRALDRRRATGAT